MSISGERGGTLLELFILVFVLATFAAGAARVHVSLSRRFDRIVRDRNETIHSARGVEAP
jgi:hypothetical protein